MTVNTISIAPGFCLIEPVESQVTSSGVIFDTGVKDQLYGKVVKVGYIGKEFRRFFPNITPGTIVQYSNIGVELRMDDGEQTGFKIIQLNHIIASYNEIPEKKILPWLRWWPGIRDFFRRGGLVFSAGFIAGLAVYGFSEAMQNRKSGSEPGRVGPGGEGIVH